jgi:hypothetical protein
MAWRPLSARDDDPSGEESLYEGVPPHLRSGLVRWLKRLLDYQRTDVDLREIDDKAVRLAVRARLALPSAYDPVIELTSALQRGSVSQTELLDLVDAALADGVGQGDADFLERLLLDGGSAWRVASGRHALERRVDPIAVTSFETAATGNAATHLAAAWTAAYGRRPEPSRAYGEAIKAVESASIPIVIPGTRGAKATLGKVIIELNDHQQNWRLAVHSHGAPAEIASLVGMLRLLWQGQTDRHGGSVPTTPVTTEAAEAAVHLAVMLVQWFHSGTVRPV